MNPLEIKGKYLHCDLNVPYHGESKLADRLQMIKRMDWDAVCINTLVKSGQDIPPPPAVNKDFGLRIFNRVTVSFFFNIFTQIILVKIVIETQHDKYNVRSGKVTNNLNKYDVIGVIAGTERLFQDTCKEIDCDIIGFDEKYKFEVRRGSVKAAIDRNVQFEFNYR